MASNLRVDTILPSSGTNVAIGTASGSVTFVGDTDISTNGDITIGGNLGIGGTLTYEDVTNIDSVGVITARSGIRIGATGANTLISGTGTGIGIGTITPNSLITIQDTGDTSIRFKNSSSVDKAFVGTSGAFGSAGTDDLRIRSDASNIVFGFSGSEKLRIGSSGQIGIAGANYGTSGQVLTSQGSGSAVQWASAGTTVADQWRVSSTFTLGGNVATLSSNWERSDTPGYGQLGSGMTESSGVFTFPSTGIYLINFNLQVYSTSALRYFGLRVQTSINNMGAVSNATESFSNFDTSNGSGQYGNCYAQTLFDVTNTSTHKVRFAGMSITGSATDILGSSTANLTSVVFLRLGNT